MRVPGVGVLQKEMVVRAVIVLQQQLSLGVVGRGAVVLVCRF